MRELYEAVSIADLEALIAAGADVNARDFDGRTLMHEAVKYPGTHLDAAQVVRALLNGGADPAARDNKDETPLHTAAFYGRTAAVRLLLDAGADVNARNDRGETPLFRAVYGNEATMRALLEAGADVLIKNLPGWTALELAQFEGRRRDDVMLPLVLEDTRRRIEEERVDLRETAAQVARDDPTLEPVVVKRKRL